MEFNPPSARAKKIRFQFRFMPWKDALEWFAQQAGLSLMADATPTGTLNYSDDREYTPVEALDLLNGVLLTKGYTLVRRERMLMLINLEDGIPPNLVPTVPPDALAAKGEYELVSVLFDLKNLRPEEAAAEIARLLGPQGSAVPLPRARQLLVTETAGRLRAIRSVLTRIEEVASDKGGPEDILGAPRPRRIPVHNTQAQEMAELVKQVYSGRLIEGIGTMRGATVRTTTPRAEVSSGEAIVQQRSAAESGRANDEPVRVTIGVDSRTNSLLVVAPRELLQEIKQLVEELDLAAGDQDKAMRVVPLHGVTPEAVEQALSAVAGDLAQFGARRSGRVSGTPAAARQPPSHSPGAAPQIGQGHSPAGQSAGASAGTVRPQPSRSPYYRGGSTEPNSATGP
jgi:type II secretory pathway component GspD/PulD (secretin)